MVEVDPMVDPMVEVYMSSKMALKIKSEVYLYTSTSTNFEMPLTQPILLESS